MSRTIMVFILTAVLFILLPSYGMAASSHDVVYKSQNKLKALGYNPGISDGIFGKKTQSALLEFQRAHKLPETGILDKKTLDGLVSSVLPEARANKLPETGRVDPEVIRQPELPVRVAAHPNSRVNSPQRDARLDPRWGLVSPTGCYWECQQQSGCHDGKEGELPQLASMGTKRGVDAQRVYHHPGWGRVCD